MNARVAVLEPYYVCLDYRSEFAAFYSHLDRPRKSHTVRLHFFSEVIQEQDLDRLEEFGDSYLGYIVCREGDMPIVGRTLLRTPDYIQEAADIEEKVNLFGQRLSIRGVPFMQQDQRHGVCAHVCMWSIQYSAYRRGFSERRVLASFVKEIKPLQPGAPDGLTEQQVIEGFDTFGLRSSRALFPSLAFPEAPAPRVPYREVVDSVSEEARPALEIALGAKPLEGVNTSRPATDPVYDANLANVAASLLNHAQQAGIELSQLLADEFLRDFIRSRFPAYGVLADHALVICGRRTDEGRPRYFVHDDQNGPYLLADPLPSLSRDTLRFQTGQPSRLGSSDRTPVPPPDRTRSFLRGQIQDSKFYGERNLQPLLAAIVATPHRIQLSPSVARREARSVVQAVARLVARTPLLREDHTGLLRSATEVRATILMGIDYKLQRRHEAKRADAVEAVRTLGAIQLAEWVVVVEGFSSSKPESVIWEVVFDASSSDLDPRQQVIRVMSSLLAVVPAFRRDSPGAPTVEEAQLECSSFSQLKAPYHVGKTRWDDPDWSANA